MTTGRSRILLLGCVGIISVAAVAMPAAQRRRADNSVHGTPIATTTIARAPGRYYGTRVTVSAAIEEVLSPTVFVLDQRKAAGPTAVVPAGAPLLVIAPHLAAAVERNRYFLVRGQVVQFSAHELARAAAGYSIDVPLSALAKYEGLPVLVASSILDSTYNELAKPPSAAARADTAAVVR